jgi:hypothetical protein
MSIVLSVRRGACTVGRRRRRSVAPRRAARDVRVGAEVASGAAFTAAVAAGAAALAAAAVSVPPSAFCAGFRRRRRRRRRALDEEVSPLAPSSFWAVFSAVFSVAVALAARSAPRSAVSAAASSAGSSFAAAVRPREERRRREPDRFRVDEDLAASPCLAVPADGPAVFSASGFGCSAASAEPCVCFDWAALGPPRPRPRLRRLRRGRGRDSVDPDSACPAWGSSASSVMQRSFPLGEPAAPIRQPRRAARAHWGTGPGGGYRQVTGPARGGHRAPRKGLGVGPARPNRVIVERGHSIKDIRRHPGLPGEALLESSHMDVQKEPHRQPVHDHRGPPVGDQG